MAVIKDSLKVIIISSVISLSALFVFAQTNWFEPSVQPPGDNRPAPLTLDEQGGLTIPGNLKIDGELNFQDSAIKTVYTNTDEDSYTNYKCYYCKNGSCNTLEYLEISSNYEVVIFPRFDPNLDCNSIEAAYSCPADVARSCKDLYPDVKGCYSAFPQGYEPANYRMRDVNCVKKGVLTIQ